MVQDVPDLGVIFIATSSWLYRRDGHLWAFSRPMPLGNEQASRERNGQAALSMNAAKTQPRGQRLQMPKSGRIISPGVRGTNVIERCSTECLTVPCASLWAEPGATSTRHSSAPPSHAWMDSPV